MQGELEVRQDSLFHTTFSEYRGNLAAIVLGLDWFCVAPTARPHLLCSALLRLNRYAQWQDMPRLLSISIASVV
jgi:hypothetical protein